MKTYLKLIIFICITNLSNAQITNSIYLDYSSLWHYYIAGWNGIYGFESFSTIYIDGDTTVNGQDYYKRFRYVHTITNSTPPSDSYMLYGPALIREDVNNNFVIYDSNAGSESVFLDNAAIVAANTGDPFPAPGATCNIESVASLSIGSQPIKHLHGSVNMPVVGIAEGIGYVGPICAVGVEGSEILVCYYRLSDSLCFTTGYSPEDFPVPQYMSLGMAKMINSAIKVYPNPASTQLNIDNLQNENFQSYSFYDTAGKSIEQGALEQQTRIDISTWGPGIYFLHLTNTEQILQIRKVVIER